ncbi:MAG TPA: flavodoxin domain-containing protein [Prolixibacteraceae bacterium]|nr:flavodoxin domain-containing protein [Prolixibacteraceae bacterium]
MKTLIIYDSYFGNTEEIGQAIAKTLQADYEVTALRAIDVTPEQFHDVKLLIMGSPTRGFRPSENTLSLLKTRMPQNLSGLAVAAFDTRIDLETIKSKAFRFMVNTGGYAATSLSKALTKRGATLLAPPEGFLVSGEQGPLKEGEIERASKWALSLIN